MRSAILTLLLTAAPVPKRPPPDPFGHGYFGILPASEERLLIAQTPKPHTPAGRAGLRAGDDLVRVGICTPKTFTDLRAYIGGLRPGTRVTVVLRRDGEERTLTVEVGARADDPDAAGPGYPVPDPPDR